MNKLRTSSGMPCIVFAGIAWSGIAAAACDQAMLGKLLDQGFTKQEILNLCGQTPGQTPPGTDPVPPRPTGRIDFARLIGTWEGPFVEGWMTLTIGADGSYALYSVSRAGNLQQTGNWSVEGSSFVMATGSTREVHPYTVDEAGTVLALESKKYGTMRLTRR